jgi:protein ImuB
MLYAVNAPAEGTGLHSGMTLADARAIFPSLTTRQASFDADGSTLSRLAGWCRRYSPWTAAGGESATGKSVIEGAGGAGLWLDATGCAHLFGGEDAMLADITARISQSGFTIRAAMADTPGCAWGVARYSPASDNTVTIPPGGARDALAPLPTAALRLPAATIAALHGVGLRRIDDLLALPRASLTIRFGETVRARLDTALGETEEPLSPTLPVTPLIARIAFPEAIGTLEDIAAALDLLLADLCHTLEQAGQGARRLVLMLWRADGSSQHCTTGTARAQRAPAPLARLFADHLGTIDPGFGIEEMTLAATVAEPLTNDQSTFERSSGTEQTGEALDSLIDRLGNRFSNGGVLRAAARESHIPERAAGFVPVAIADQAVPARSSPRPVRLLRPAEQIEAVTGGAEEPPLLFRWRRVLYHTARCEGPERIAPEWWRDGPQSTRDYYRIEDRHGKRFWLYRETDNPSGKRWFLHGLFG